MAEYYPPKVDYTLNIDQKYYNTLDIECFSQMMKDPSYCYKFYWLEAIVKLISEGVTDTTFNEIIDEMITNAWYSVREFHIHLTGSYKGDFRDSLEKAVNILSELTQLPSNASKVEIKNACHDYSTQIRECKNKIAINVPYFALSGFEKRGNKPEKTSPGYLVRYFEALNKTVLLPYTIGSESGLQRTVHFSADWIHMIQDNTVSILGWVQYEKMKWLQIHNPEVPGLVYKLAPLDEKMRKLNNVRKLWEGVLDLELVHDVFTDHILEKKNYDVDHFIPWSFVMNDELWNLMPMESSLNSSKSNHLPKWELFFDRFASNQFQLYNLIHKTQRIHKLYEACYHDNLHSLWAERELYRPGNTKQEFCNILQKNMQPVYDSARRQGYDLWEYEGNSNHK